MFRKKTNSKTRDRGAVIVEFAIIAPILVLLFQGTVEFGLMWRESSNLANAVSQSTRSMAALGGNGYADHEGMLSLRTALGSNSRLAFDDGDYFLVYDASGTPEQAELNKKECELPEGSTANTYIFKERCSRFPAYIAPAERNDANEPRQECPNEVLPENDRPFGWFLGSFANNENNNELLLVGSNNCSAAQQANGINVAYTPCKRIWALSKVQNINFQQRAKIGLEIQGSYKSLTGLFGGLKVKQNAVYQIVPCDVKDSLPGGACS